MKLFETSAAVLAAAADGGGCKWVPLGWGGGMVVNFNIFVIKILKYCLKTKELYLFRFRV